MRRAPRTAVATVESTLSDALRVAVVDAIRPLRDDLTELKERMSALERLVAASVSPPGEAEPMAVKLKSACAMLGCGMTKLNELLNAGAIQGFHEGRNHMVVVASIRAHMARRISEPPRARFNPAKRPRTKGEKLSTLPHPLGRGRV